MFNVQDFCKLNIHKNQEINAQSCRTNCVVTRKSSWAWASESRITECPVSFYFYLQLVKMVSRTMLRIIVALQFAIVISATPCPRIESCKTGDMALERECASGAVPCPGGRLSCLSLIRKDNNNSTKTEECCCVQYDQKYKHLSKGSPKPPRNPSKLRFYFMQYCPYCHRVALVTGYKFIQADPTYINLKDRPEWFIELSDTVPALETDDGIINGSLIVSDYLDETYPSQGELYPDNTWAKASDRILIEYFDKTIPLIFSLIVTGNWNDQIKNSVASTETLVQKFEDEIIKLEEELSRRGTRYFSGNHGPGMIDFMIWPWFERRPVIQILYPSAINYTKSSQILAEWIWLMKNQPTVRNAALAPQLYMEFYASARNNNGTPNYNLLAGTN